MSNISTENIVGKIFSPIVTNLTYDELDNMRMEEISMNIPNCILFSIPQTNYTSENDDVQNEDIQGEGSIWLTDTNGYLYCMTKPINKYLEFESLINIISPTSNIKGDKEIKSIKWYPGDDIIENDCSEGINPILYNLLNGLIITYNDNTTDILNTNVISNFKLKVTTDKDGKFNANSFWYNNIGTYYIRGIVLGYQTVDNKDLETTNVLKWEIKEGYEIPDTPIIPDNPDTPTPVTPSYSGYYWYIGTEVPSSISNVQTDNKVAGWHKIGTSLNGFVLNTALDENTVVLNRTQRVPAYIIIPNELHIYNGLGQMVENNIEVYTPQECNISGYKAYYNIPDPDFPDGYRSIAGPIIKE